MRQQIRRQAERPNPGNTGVARGKELSTGVVPKRSGQGPFCGAGTTRSGARSASQLVRLARRMFAHRLPSRLEEKVEPLLKHAKADKLLTFEVLS